MKPTEFEQLQAHRHPCAARNFTIGAARSACQDVAEVKAIDKDGQTYWLCWLHHQTWQGGTSLANVLAGTRDRAAEDKRWRSA